MSVRQSLVQQFFAPDVLSCDHGLKRCPATTYFALMGTLGVVMDDPFIEIGLELFDGLEQRFTERDLVEFLKVSIAEQKGSV